MRKLGLSLLLLLSCLLVACNQKEAANELKIGTISGPETQLMQVAKQVAREKYGLNIDIVQFTDYTMPNQALSDGEIDANMFQTIPYLNADMQAHHYDLVVIGKAFIYPMAVYSQKIKNINAVPDNAVVAIPNDPSNQARALLLLQAAGLIKLKPGVDVMATPNDVVSNPKKLQIKALDAANLPRVLPDVTLAVINTNYAVPAGLYPTKDGLFIENKDSPYVNVVVVRSGEQNDAKFKELILALHSPEVLAAAKNLFQGQAIPGWM